jgi:hypothetical protein
MKTKLAAVLVAFSLFSLGVGCAPPTDDEAASDDSSAVTGSAAQSTARQIKTADLAASDDALTPIDLTGAPKKAQDFAKTYSDTWGDLVALAGVETFAVPHLGTYTIVEFTRMTSVVANGPDVAVHELHFFDKNGVMRAVRAVRRRADDRASRRRRLRRRARRRRPSRRSPSRRPRRPQRRRSASMSFRAIGRRLRTDRGPRSSCLLRRPSPISQRRTRCLQRLPQRGDAAIERLRWRLTIASSSSTQGASSRRARTSSECACSQRLTRGAARRRRERTSRAFPADLPGQKRPI